MKKMKEDYLALEEFQGEMIECATDTYFWGFGECSRQVKELDLNFDVARLKKSDKLEDEEEEDEEEDPMDIDSDASLTQQYAADQKYIEKVRGRRVYIYPSACVQEAEILGKQAAIWRA